MAVIGMPGDRDRPSVLIVATIISASGICLRDPGRYPHFWTEISYPGGSLRFVQALFSGLVKKPGPYASP